MANFRGKMVRYKQASHPKLDENGNPVVNQSGKQVMTVTRERSSVDEGTLNVISAAFPTRDGKGYMLNSYIDYSTLKLGDPSVDSSLCEKKLTTEAGIDRNPFISSVFLTNAQYDKFLATAKANVNVNVCEKESFGNKRDNAVFAMQTRIDSFIRRTKDGTKVEYIPSPEPDAAEAPSTNRPIAVTKSYAKQIRHYHDARQNAETIREWYGSGKDKEVAARKAAEADKTVEVVEAEMLDLSPIADAPGAPATIVASEAQAVAEILEKADAPAGGLGAADVDFDDMFDDSLPI